MSLVVAKSVSSSRRLERAKAWLSGRDNNDQLVIVGNSAEAANHLARDMVSAKGVAFGWHRLSWTQLAYASAKPVLVEKGLAPVGRIGADALVASVVTGSGTMAG